MKELAWPASRVPDAIAALAFRAGFPAASKSSGAPPSLDRHTEPAWVQTSAALAGLEAEAMDVPYVDLESDLRTLGPALLRLPGAPYYFVLTARGRLLSPELQEHDITPSSLRAELARTIESGQTQGIDGVLDAAAIPPTRRDRARNVLLRKQLASARVSGIWRLRIPATAPIEQQWSLAGLTGGLLALGALHFLYTALWTVSWWIVGRAALQGRLDTGWLIAWMLMLATLVPVRMSVTWRQGLLATRASTLVRERMLAGAMRLEAEEILRDGAGRSVGRVFEAESIDSLAINGAFAAALSVLELLFAAGILAAAGGLAAVLLAASVGVTVMLGFHYRRRSCDWARSRMDMTVDLIEGMVGHRTRLSQEHPEHWHELEDKALDQYLHVSRNRDVAQTLLVSLPPRGWLILGTCSLVPAFLNGAADVSVLAASLAGVILGHRALRRLVGGARQIADAAVAWEQIQPLMDAASRPSVLGNPAIALANHSGSRDVPILEAVNLTYRYPKRRAAALEGASLRIHAGDRVLLQGPSGGGKSTFASCLAGLRCPQAGLLLAGGLDSKTAGEQNWRRRVAAAPQFHINHVITGSLAFNLLLGRPGPHTRADYAEADAICRELGLGPLLDRMPAGIEQLVGETGWQLSHGERSRVFLARALLQGAPLVVLDESFAALDPETFRQSLGCVLMRAQSLILVAHE